jgi:hypothetical protein
MPKASDEKVSDVSKDESRRLWEAALKNVPDDYQFVITSQGDSFPKGS